MTTCSGLVPWRDTGVGLVHPGSGSLLMNGTEWLLHKVTKSYNKLIRSRGIPLELDHLGLSSKTPHFDTAGRSGDRKTLYSTLARWRCRVERKALHIPQIMESRAEFAGITVLFLVGGDGTQFAGHLLYEAARAFAGSQHG